MQKDGRITWEEGKLAEAQELETQLEKAEEDLYEIKLVANRIFLKKINRSLGRDTKPSTNC